MLPNEAGSYVRLQNLFSSPNPEGWNFCLRLRFVLLISGNESVSSCLAKFGIIRFERRLHDINSLEFQYSNKHSSGHGIELFKE